MAPDWSMDLGEYCWLKHCCKIKFVKSILKTIFRFTSFLPVDIASKMYKVTMQDRVPYNVLSHNKINNLPFIIFLIDFRLMS